MATVKKTQKQKFTLTGKFLMEVNLQVEAESLEDALRIGRELTFSDFVTLNEDADLFDAEKPFISSVWHS